MEDVEQLQLNGTALIEALDQGQGLASLTVFVFIAFGDTVELAAEVALPGPGGRLALAVAESGVVYALVVGGGSFQQHYRKHPVAIGLLVSIAAVVCCAALTALFKNVKHLTRSQEWALWVVNVLLLAWAILLWQAVGKEAQSILSGALIAAVGLQAACRYYLSLLAMQSPGQRRSTRPSWR